MKEVEEERRGEWWVLAHPVACLSTVSEIMCCGYTGVTALRPDVGGGLRTYIRMCARELSSSFAFMRSLSAPPVLYIFLSRSSFRVAPIVFSHECTLL